MPRNPNNPYNSPNKEGYDPSQPVGIDPTVTSANDNLGYFSSNPDLLSRQVLRDFGHGGQNYGFDPYSQYLQNRSLAASTLGTYLNPSSNPGVQDGYGSGDPTKFTGASQYYNGLFDSNAIVNALRGMGVNVKSWEDAGATPGGAGGLAGAATDPNMLAALSVFQDPQAAMKLVESAMAGLPSPIANSLGGLSQMLYHMFQDAKPSLGNMSFFNWLIGDQGHQNVATPAFNPGAYTGR